MTAQPIKEHKITNSAHHKQQRVAVLLPRPLDRAYDYLLPAGEAAETGCFVDVPFGRDVLTGIVWGDGDMSLPDEKLKTVLRVYDFPPLTKEQIKFLDWVADYTVSPKGMLVKMAFPEETALAPEPLVPHYGLADARQETQKDPAAEKLSSLQADMWLRAPELKELTGLTKAQADRLCERGWLERRNVDPLTQMPQPVADFITRTFSPEQAEAVTYLNRAVEDDAYKTFLLDGVTGSGKTEVYFEAIATALQKGGQVLVLLPEIALTSAFLGRFEGRFGVVPTVWHSGLTPSQRRKNLRAIALGHAKVIVGARSALFLPYQNLRLMVVDEEHDSAYKQEEGVLYNARDMAVMRAFHEKSVVVLSTATPSLETMQNVWVGKYEHVILPDRHGGAQMPYVHLIDLRSNGPASRSEFIAPVLRRALADNFAKGEQSLLFLNRRGYAPLTLCRSCGHKFECPNCSSWLVEHRRESRLVCHHCGYQVRPPESCPACHEEDAIQACGPGVERILDEVNGLFPQARVSVLSSDTTDTLQMLQAKLEAITEQQVDIIIGTQIIAKGHHMPGLTLVGVIDADLGLAGGDLRAAERSFQLLTQVAGRAGREQKPGTVFLQTFHPESRVMQSLVQGDRDNFLTVEAAERQHAHMPPYTKLAGIIVSGENEMETLETARLLAQKVPAVEGMRVLGPAQAPIYRIRNKFRQRLLVQAAKGLSLSTIMKEWLASIKVPARVDVRVDVDPQNFL